MAKSRQKYSFVAPLEYLGFTRPLGTGWQIANDLHISTSQSLARRLINPSLHQSIGDIEVSTILSGKPFLYALSEYPHEDTSPETQLNLLGSHLQIARVFFNSLWLIRDNSVNFDRGFLQFPYTRHSIDSRVSSNGWTSVLTTADGTLKKITLSKLELQESIAIFQSLYDISDPDVASPVIGSIMASTGEAVNRIGTALYFLQGARATSNHALKVTYYCVCFEALVSTEVTGVAHQVAERVASLIKNDSSEALKIYNNIKKAYSTRSKIVHGGQVDLRKGRYLNQSLSCDDYVRRLILVIITNRKFYEAITQNPKVVDRFFLNKILGL